jgi:NAD(P)-dependent dehydrogenase (short-subunit alcohol dehydrogenase family)
MGLTSNFSQSFPPAPPLTESNLPSQDGKVFIVTGGYSGVGKELARILYHARGKVYIAGRSETKYNEAVEDIKKGAKDSTTLGQLEFLPLELGNLASIRKSAEDFLSREPKVDVLWNNAATAMAPSDSTTKDGHDLTMGTNCLGPCLFTKLILPGLKAAAAEKPPGSVRVVWSSSLVVDGNAPKGGFRPSDLTTLPQSAQDKYTLSKTGNWFLASELGKRVEAAGILSVTQNPGNLNTNLLRHMPRLLATLLSPILHEPKYGAYTELYAGLSQDLTIKDSGAYIIPWGRKHTAPRRDLLLALKSTEEGGSGNAAKFWEYCENNTRIDSKNEV